jgi:hypothetical protein
MRWPALPTVVDAPAGAVKIRLVKSVTHDDGTVCNGIYDSEKRIVRIDRTLPPSHRWKVLYHEMVHVALLDAGLDNGLPDAMHEAIADAISSARIRERFGNEA